MDVMKVMKQAQDLQKKLKDAQKELSNMEITGEAAEGTVVVTCDGQGKFKSIKIKPELIDPDNPDAVEKDVLEMIEDVVTTAFLQANMNAAKVMEAKMKEATGGMNIPGLF